MPRSCLLDTSSFRSIPAAQLAAAGSSVHLSASPFCFWELLTHLEDEGQFERIKGNLMKFRHVRVLDDPWASIERGLVREGDAVHQRPEDGDLAYATLAALRDSRSVAEFYGKHIRDSRGQVREIAGSIARVRDILKAEEERFQGYMSQVMSVVRDGAVGISTPTDQHRGTLHIVDAWRIQLGHRVEQSEAAHSRLVSRTYVYSSYVLHLAMDYLKRGVTSVDRNDFEDAKFCLHLALDADITAVTNDAPLQRCLKCTLAVLASLGDIRYDTKLRVVNASEFTTTPLCSLP